MKSVVAIEVAIFMVLASFICAQNKINPLSPPNKSKNQSVNGLILSWESNHDNFDIYFGTDNPPTNIIYNINQQKKSYKIDRLNFEQTYYWRIVAHKTGKDDIESPISSFITREIVKLVSPLNSSNYQNYGGALLRWDSQLDSFDVFVGTNVDSLYPLIINHNKKWFRTARLDSGKTYYWKVVGHDKIEDKSSSIWSFTTDNPCISIQKCNLSIDSTIYGTEMNWIRRDSLVYIDLAKTAVILIDVWYNNELPSPNFGVWKRIKNLVNIARRHGIPVFHLPHEGGEELIWKEIKPLYDEILLPEPWDKVLIEPYLEKSGITTLLYAGFDTSVCLLCTRPNSIVPLSKRAKYNIILLKDCTSAIPLLQFWAIRGVKERHAVTDIPRLMEAFGEDEIEPIEPLADVIPKNINLIDYWSSNSSTKNIQIEPLIDFPQTETALILINIWNNFDNDGWLKKIKKNTLENIYPLLEVARRKKIKVCHVPNEREIDSLCLPLKNEPIIKSKKELDAFLTSNKIESIIFVGNLTNQTNFLFPLDYPVFFTQYVCSNRIILENCITVMETPETFDFEGMKKAFLLLIGSTGSPHFIKTLDPAKFIPFLQK